MSKKFPLTDEQIRICEEWLQVSDEGTMSKRAFAKSYSISDTTLRRWFVKYDEMFPLNEMLVDEVATTEPNAEESIADLDEFFGSNSGNSKEVSEKEPITSNVCFSADADNIYLFFNSQTLTFNKTKDADLFNEVMVDCLNENQENLKQYFDIDAQKRNALIALIKLIGLNVLDSGLIYSKKHKKTLPVRLVNLIIQRSKTSLSTTSSGSVTASSARDYQAVVDLAKFVDNLILLEDYKIENLLQFMDKCTFNYNNNGRISAYKVVRHDYLDKHSQTFDNTPGNVITMPRSDVNPDTQQTCAEGLHVCSIDYIKHFISESANDRIVEVEVNLRDFVAIPNDYNHAKARVCRYKVIRDVTDIINYA